MLSIVMVSIFVAFLFATSFLFFLIRAHNTHAIPWLVALVVVSIIVLELFVREFPMAYRRPILYSLIVIGAVMLLGIFVIDRMHAHEALERRAMQGRLPGAGRLYRHYGLPRNNMHRPL